MQLHNQLLSVGTNQCILPDQEDDTGPIKVCLDQKLAHFNEQVALVDIHINNVFCRSQLLRKFITNEFVPATNGYTSVCNLALIMIIDPLQYCLKPVLYFKFDCFQANFKERKEYDCWKLP